MYGQLAMFVKLTGTVRIDKVFGAENHAQSVQNWHNGKEKAVKSAEYVSYKFPNHKETRKIK